MRLVSKALATALAIGISLPAIAIAQGTPGRDTPPPPPPAARDNGPADAERGPGGHGGPRWGDHRWVGKHGRDRGPGRLWDMAGKLAAAEVALGITDQQKDAWRGFTSAFIAFAEAGRPGFDGTLTPPAPAGDDAARADDEAAAADPADDEASASDGQDDRAADDADDLRDDERDAARSDDARTLEDLRGVRMLNRMIDRKLDQAEAATRLRTAVNTLSGVLTPEQVAIADRLLKELRPHRGWRHGGPRGGWHGWHHGRDRGNWRGDDKRWEPRPDFRRDGGSNVNSPRDPAPASAQ
ncbi:hypothetical protein [Mangrovicella endophytica]|uniref:hypothetical protein n=1 Tax=Mangrovicella endophytica TaxID=2066697 RepID=UPI000C9E79ED|nr:hypothetical protein [Mangrovicella endophytica]